MREAVTEDRLRQFMRTLAREAREPGRIYITGGASAVLHGWRTSTLDIDLKMVPESERILRALPELKERLQINIELVSPADFVPPLPGWEERSSFIAQEGLLSFHHFDFYSQCLSKLERDHCKDRADIESMIRDGLVEPPKLLALFRQVERELYRYPALDPKSLRTRVEALASR